MTTTVSHGIENLFAVEQDIFRGGQPSSQGWKWLCGEGVTDVIKLNTEHEGSDAEAEALGMVVHRFPIPWWRQTVWRPSQSDLIKVVAILASRMSPAFLHCKFGMDRSGLAVGCFRLWQGWTKKDAYQEMEDFGFHEVSLQGLEGRWDSIDPASFVAAVNVERGRIDSHTALG